MYLINVYTTTYVYAVFEKQDLNIDAAFFSIH